MKTKLSMVFMAFCLFAFLIGSVLSTRICFAEKYINLCQTAQIRDNEQLEYVGIAGSRLTAVIDGDPNTYLTKSCVLDQWLDIQFPGARKWVNFIQVQYTGKDDFKFEIFNFKGERHDIKVLSTDLKDGSESRQIKIIEFEPLQAKGIRWSWVGAGSPNETINIYEISAWFYQPDPDPPIDTDVDDSLNWLLCETSVEMGVQDINPLWYKITSLTDWCPQGSHDCHFVKPPGDKAGDFVSEAIGGGENSHNFWTGMDYHDLSVIAQHGCPCHIFFTSGPFPLNRRLDAPIDVFHCWGDRDAEWFCALSCSPYKGLCKWAWATAFDGLHLQCGFTTTAYETNGKFLGGFAGYMISSNDDDPALAISQSWFLAKNKFMSPVSEDPICAIVLADDWRAFNDHLWGQGPVSEDPSLENGRLRGIVWAIRDSGTSSSGENSMHTEYLPQLTQEQSKLRSPLESPYMTIPASSPIGIPVKTNASIYTQNAVVTMTRHYIQPMLVNYSTVQSMATKLCAKYGILCSPSIGQDEEGEWWATQDQYALWGDPEHGVIQFVNTDEYLTKKSLPVGIPVFTTALNKSNMLLDTLDINPDSYSNGCSYNLQTAYDLDQQAIIGDSSFKLSINVEYYRLVDTFDVVGPGAHITVTWTSSPKPQHFTRGGWHDLSTSKAVDSCLSVQEAIILLTTIGEQATIGGIPAECDSLHILSSRLTYYETNGEYETDRLEPVYDFLAVAQSQQCGDETLHVYVPNRADILRGEIDTPSNGSQFHSWDTVTFTGHATGGTSPYTFNWSSNVDGYLDTGNSITTASLSAVGMGPQFVPHTITLTVTDAHGKTSNASISVCITNSGDANGDEGINSADVAHLINYLFVGGPAPDPLAAGNVNCDGLVNSADVVYLINYLFLNGPPPCCYCY